MAASTDKGRTQSVSSIYNCVASINEPRKSKQSQGCKHDKINDSTIQLKKQ